LAAVVSSLTPALASNDPFFPDEWGLAQIHAPEAWPSDSGAGITIGIVDTGVDATHPDLAGRIGATTACINTGGDPTKCGGSGADIDGHGTHVTGIAVADAGNGAGVAGVAPNARVVVARVFQQATTSDGKPGMSATVADVNAGIKWVVSQGARVVNLSLGLDPGRPPPSNFLIFGAHGSQTLGTGIEWAWANGAVPVLAAGNDANGQVDYPNAHAIIVGATRRNGQTASYSTSLSNSRWGMVAPGGENSDPSEGIVSTWTQGRYAYLAGTSMAVPHVSAAVAMLLAQGLTKDAAVQRILNSADKIGCGSGCQGFLDVSNALGVQLAATPTTALPAVGTAPPAAGTRGRGSTVRVPAREGSAVVAPTPTTSMPAPPSTAATTVDPITTAPRPKGQQVTLSVRHDDDNSGSHPVTAGVAVALLAAVLSATAFVVRRRRGV
jgi:subtilisin family serine protease